MVPARLGCPGGSQPVASLSPGLPPPPSSRFLDVQGTVVSPKGHVYPEPQDLTLSGHRVFAEVIGSVKMSGPAFPPWRSGMGGVSAVPERRFDPQPGQWIKDPEVLQLQLRLKLQLGSDPWPGNSICRGAAKNKK